MKVYIDKAHASDNYRVVCRVSDPRFETVYDILGEQLRSCVFAAPQALLERLGFREGQVESAEAYNVTEDHEGLEERLVGWSFMLRVEKHEEGAWF